MTKRLDLRGLSCPEPVIRSRATLASADDNPVSVLVDNLESASNVRRMAESLGCSAQTEQRPDGILISIDPGGGTCDARTDPADRRTVLFVPSDAFGQGDDRLGRVLMRAAIKTARELPHPAHRAIFINAGVKLCCEGTDLLEDIRKLERAGAEVLCCGTCLDFYGLKEKLLV